MDRYDCIRDYGMLPDSTGEFVNFEKKIKEVLVKLEHEIRTLRFPSKGEVLFEPTYINGSEAANNYAQKLIKDILK